METVSFPPSSGTQMRLNFSCTRCAERKVKCNRQRPCRACVNHNVDCVYKPPRPPKRRQKHANDQVLVDRLNYYEALLRENGIDPSAPINTPRDGQQVASSQTAVAREESHPPRTSSSIEIQPGGNVSKAQVIHGQGRSMFVENSLLSRVVEEFNTPEDALEEPLSESSDAEPPENDFNYVVGSCPRFESRTRQPTPEMILQLWETFVENVDPLTKLVHVPTLRPAIQKAASNLDAIPKGLEALMFAIFAAAILSLSDYDCNHKFHEPRKLLLPRYINATKQALSRARFMETTALIVLQALVLHLVSVRDIYEPRAVWSLTGVAVRIAQAMGLERDGLSLGLSPFETEMRRRLWWLLKTHDHRAAELCGLSKFRDLDSGPECTKWPSNVDDEQLYPGMASFPPESKTLSDSMFVSLRYELVSFAASRVTKFRQEGKNFNQWDSNLATGGDKMNSDETLQELETLLGMRYLRHCDPSQPLHLLTMLMARAAINTIRFLTHHPRRWTSIAEMPASERQWVWDICINLLEQYSVLQSNPLLKRFSWHVNFVMQWHVFIHVLDTLRANPLTADANKVWRLIGSTFEGYPAMVADTGKLMHLAVGNLCLKAYNARTAALIRKNTALSPTPEFIQKLQQQQDIARTKRQARDAKSIQAKHRSSHEGDSQLSTNIANPTYTVQLATSLTRSVGGMKESDPFYYLHALDENQTGSLDKMLEMDIDLGLMPREGYGIEDSAINTINWEQWDTWITDSNSIPSSLD